MNKIVQEKRATIESMRTQQDPIACACIARGQDAHENPHKNIEDEELSNNSTPTQ